ncbi:DUF3379 family protein [Agaribacter flavus]|uniref:DUF3379 family protein n=1 Tax=Agaribacter flavus TaxID=1902781 RepID=A0ABV7FVV8_9ALTE
MDDLTFRRTVYADPFTKEPEVILAAKADPKKQAFWEELKTMDRSIQQAMNISIPENLAEKLLLRQSISEHAESRQKRPWYIAMAASVVLATVLTISMFNQGTSSSIALDALAHVQHAELESSKYGDISMQDVNAKLANYNGSISDAFGEIISANYCYLSSVKSLHLIVQGQKGLLSLFVLPNDKNDPVDPSFSNEAHRGKSFLLESARIIVVGDDNKEVDTYADKAKRFMLFSA